MDCSPDKGRQWVIVSRSECPVSSVFLSEADLNDITQIATITLPLETIQPVFLIASNVHFCDPDFQTEAPGIVVSNAPTGCQTNDSIRLDTDDIPGLNLDLRWAFL
jgi:hypothetical protein